LLPLSQWHGRAVDTSLFQAEVTCCTAVPYAIALSSLPALEPAASADYGRCKY